MFQETGVENDPMKLALWMLCGVVALMATPSAWGKDAGDNSPNRPVLAPICSVEEAAELQSLAKATIPAIDAGKGPDIVAKITALEGAWDAREKTLRPKNDATWRVLDETLDRAIAALRGSKTNLPTGRAALESLMAELEQATVGRAASAPEAAPAAASAPEPVASVPAAVYAAKETAEFKVMIKATIQLFDGGKNTEAIAQLTDLETAWDAREAALKPRAPATWLLLDRTLDEGIMALRSSSKTDIPKGKAALEDLLRKMDQATRPVKSEEKH